MSAVIEPILAIISCRNELANVEITPSEQKQQTISLGWRKKTKSKIEKTCTVELLKKRLPIVTWLPTYNWSMFIFDMIAGVTVGLTLIPQSIGYAAVAGLPLQVNIHTYTKIISDQ